MKKIEALDCTHKTIPEATQDLVQKLNELIDVVNELTGKKPQEGFVCYAIDTNGKVFSFTWHDDSQDNDMFRAGLIFRTSEQAEAHKARLIKLANSKELRDIVDKWNS